MTKRSQNSSSVNLLILTPAQNRVMAWLGKGWKGYVTRGSIVEVNGQRIALKSTFSSLVGKGLLEVDSDGCYRATTAGVAYVRGDRRIAA